MTRPCFWINILYRKIILKKIEWIFFGEPFFDFLNWWWRFHFVIITFLLIYRKRPRSRWRGGDGKNFCRTSRTQDRVCELQELNQHVCFEMCVSPRNTESKACQSNSPKC